MDKIKKFADGNPCRLGKNCGSKSMQTGKVQIKKVQIECPTKAVESFKNVDIFPKKRLLKSTITTTVFVTIFTIRLSISMSN